MDDLRDLLLDDSGEAGDQPTAEEQGSNIPLRIVGFDDVPLVFANDIQVSIDAMTLHLVFTQFLPPPVNTPSDMQRITEQGFVPVNVVARVVVPPALVEQMIVLLGQQLEAQRGQADQFAADVRQQLAAGAEEKADAAH